MHRAAMHFRLNRECVLYYCIEDFVNACVLCVSRSCGNNRRSTCVFFYGDLRRNVEYVASIWITNLYMHVTLVFAASTYSHAANELV